MKSKLIKTLALLCFATVGFSAHAIPIAGTSTGIFENPVGPAGMVVTGVGTDVFTWGIGSPPSRLQFAGNTFASVTGVAFDIGSITYFNGSINAGSQADAIDLAISIAFTDPTGINQAFSYMLSLVNTPNTGSAQNQADIVQFPTDLPSQSFTVGGMAYTVGLEVGTTGAGGFTTQNTFSVLENSTATAQLRGIVTAVAVPEPGSLVLLVVGLLGLGIARRGKKVQA